MTSVTIKAFPSPTIQVVIFFAGVPPDAPNAKQAVGWILSQLPDLIDGGLRGYNNVSPHGTVPIPIEGVPKTLAGMSGQMILTNSSSEVVIALMDSFINNIRAKFNGTYAHYLTSSLDNWMQLVNNFPDDSQGAGGTLLQKSNLIGREALTKDPDAMADAVYKACEPATSGGMSFFALGGKGIFDATPRGGSNAVNPGWRKAYVHGSKS
jgi:hypothetical protein